MDWEQQTTPPSISIFESPSMVGLSLQCGDCGALLKSVEDAEDHAELTSHTNFFKSTEAVLNLACVACGKPCRSKAETDLHTKRTGHVDFTDKTMEAAKPIELEVPKAVAAAMDMDGPAAGGESSDQPQGMRSPTRREAPVLELARARIHPFPGQDPRAEHQV